MMVLKEKAKKYKEDLEKKDTQISKYETQLEELQSAAKIVKRTEESPEDDNKDREYKNIDTSEGDNYANFDVSAGGEDYANVDTTAEGSSYANINTSDLEKDKDVSQQDEECGPEDYGAPYVNVKVDEDDDDDKKEDQDEKKKDEGDKDKDVNEKDDVEKKNDEEGEIEKTKDEKSDDVPGFDCIAKTATITSSSQLSRVKVSTTLKRKPPSRGLLRRAAEESGSQGDLFGVGETEEGDYVNMPVNSSVREPTQKPKQEDDKSTDVKDNDKNEEKVILYFKIICLFICLLQKDDGDATVASTEDKPEVNDKPPVTNTEAKSNKLPPPVADKSPLVAEKSPLAPVRSKHKVGGIAMLPVAAQMEELLSRKRFQTESAPQKDSEETHSSRFASVSKPPPVVKKKPVRAPLKSADFIDEDSKSSDFSSGKARSMDNLASACDEEELTGSTSLASDKLSKRISASMSVEDFKNSPPPPTAAKPPAVKARKLIPGAVKLIAPMPRTGKVELNEENQDKAMPTDENTTDNATPKNDTLTDDQDKQDVNVDTPQPPDSPSDITDVSPEEEETPGDSQQDNLKPDGDDGKQSQATGGSENIDLLLLPEWNTEQVCIWLQRCGLGELATGIKLGNVTGKILMDLDSSKMKVRICVDSVELHTRRYTLVATLLAIISCRVLGYSMPTIVRRYRKKLSQ